MDHPDIRRVFDGFAMQGSSIKYSTANTHGKPQTSKELVITNWMRFDEHFLNEL